MQPGSPFHLIETLGSCQVGNVWSAVDAQGRSLTVAVLDASVAADQRWREAFAEAANLLSREGRPPFLYADFSASAPFVAYAVDGFMGAEQVFQALGMEYQLVPPDVEYALPPVNETPAAAEPYADLLQQPGAAVPDPPTAPVADNAPAPAPGADHAPADLEATQPTAPSSAPPGPWTVESPAALPPQPVSPPQSQYPPIQPVSASPMPVSGSPIPVSATPHSPMPFSPAPHSPSSGPIPPAGPAPYDPYYPGPAASPKRRTGLIVGAVALVVIVLLGGGGFVAWQALGNEKEEPRTLPTATSAAPLPTVSPLQPGLEPPRVGDWPVWPVYAKGAQVATHDLDGLGFKLTLPANWECTPGGQAEGFVKYNCGAKPSVGVEIGGELIVRDCPQPCDDQRQVDMRKAEEAWGLQWRFAGEYAVLAETVKLDGGTRYGLVIVAFWRSTPEGAIDRQLVFRMTSPSDWLNDLRRVANGVRDQTKF
ncbi:hypothetical protein RB614_01095 [Phytohabitans sp. ZYX-F-186]|uniref:Uncharacterized protein n=1 Tax=Phytohabitans maris TaxID=3071409 RepID=A0ABU0Z9H6_9ACTN|nr:hypothetical protein [Phytohabitans sp. ZYX-F-186]MDQ7903114.1 hypothetical protein [Phytohabitans sp. ZYX-F-186]